MEIWRSVAAFDSAWDLNPRDMRFCVSRRVRNQGNFTGWGEGEGARQVCVAAVGRLAQNICDSTKWIKLLPASQSQMICGVHGCPVVSSP